MRPLSAATSQRCILTDRTATISATFAISYGLAFASITATIVHAALYFRKPIMVHLQRSLAEQPDVHAQLMAKYPQGEPKNRTCVVSCPLTQLYQFPSGGKSYKCIRDILDRKLTLRRYGCILGAYRHLLPWYLLPTVLFSCYLRLRVSGHRALPDADDDMGADRRVADCPRKFIHPYLFLPMLTPHVRYTLSQSVRALGIYLHTFL